MPVFSTPSTPSPMHSVVEASPFFAPRAPRPFGGTGAAPFRLVALAAALALLGGCAGNSQMSSSGGGLGTLVQSGDVAVVQITPELVALNRSKAQPTVPQELLAYRPESYQISPGDTIQVTVWDHPELTTGTGSEGGGGRLVHPDGTFYYPYVGTLNVEGMKIEELRSVITGKLAHYLQTPQVDVNVVGYGSRVTLQGAFVNTTPQDITTVPLTVSQAVGTAVIDVDQADLSGLVLTREGKNYTINLDEMNRDLDTAPPIYLKPGDRLYLPFNDRKEVYVLGEVRNPQAITFKTSGLTLTQALGRSGGLDPVTANNDAVYVIRGMDRVEQEPATVFQLDASSPAAFALADEFEIQPGDVVYVGAAGVTQWNRFLSQLLPLSGIIRNATVPGSN